MALRVFLTLPGIVVMLAFIVVGLSTLPSSGVPGQVNFLGSGQQNGAPPQQLTCTSTSIGCFNNGYPNNAIVTCQTPVLAGGGNYHPPCDLADNCNNVPNVPGVYCGYILWVFPTTTWMDNGVVIQFGPTGNVIAATAPSAVFNYGPLSAGSLLVMVTVAVGVAALAGIAIFGSGENAESVHILFIGGLLLGLWGILSAAEGFVIGNPNSGFAQVNAATGFPLGTGLYLVLTLFYVVGITGAVSRGS